MLIVFLFPNLLKILYNYAMRKTKSSTTRSKKKLPKKVTRKKSLVKVKKKVVKKLTKKKTVKARVKKTTKTRTKKKNIKKLKVSKFKLEEKDQFIVDNHNDTPIINFQPNFLVEQMDVNELLDQVEINEQDSILIREPEIVEDIGKSKELERLIQDEYLLAENIIGKSNYNLEMKEDDVAVNKSNKIQKKSQHLVNLRNKVEESLQPIILNPHKLNIVRKQTIKSVSSLYVRELLFLSSKSKLFKFTHFFGKNIVAYCFYVTLMVSIIFKSVVNVLFGVLVSVNSLGEKIYKMVESIGIEKKRSNVYSSRKVKKKITNWRDAILNFNPILIFKTSTIKTYSNALSFLFICLLIIASVQAMALIGQFNFTKGKVLGISEQAFGQFSAGMQSIVNSDFNEAQDNFLSANQKFVEAEEEISKYNNVFIEILKFVPAEGRKLDYGMKFLEAGKLFSEAAGHISLALEQQDGKLSLTDKIKVISNNLEQSKFKLKQVSNDIAGLDPKVLPSEYREEFSLIQEGIPLIINNLDELDSVLEVILDILGADSPKRYLMLFQNSSELRPTGGFMGSLALLDVQNGQINKIKVPEGGPYDLKAGFFENVMSPKELHSINPQMNLWDANWFADFPTSAELILKYWEKSGGPTVNGVITINSDVMVEFLKIIGSINLEDRGIEINSDNFIRETQEIVEIRDAGQAPKAVIGEMMSKIMDRVFNDRDLDYLQTLKLFNDSMQNKDIQIYFPDASLESTISNYGWGGAMTDTSGDYLAVINTNIGGAKTDPFIYEIQDHQVNILSNGTIIDTLKITRNFIPEKDNPFSRDTNKTYLRVYVPQGAKLLGASGFEEFPEEEYMIPVYGSKEDEDIQDIQGRFMIDEISGIKINNEFNKTVFSGWQELEPGQKKTITLRYELPFKLSLNQDVSLIDKFFKEDENLNLDTYTVFYEKQSGKTSELHLSYNWSDNLDLVWSNIPQSDFKIILDKNKAIGLILTK
jgi:Protein of unknown function (DUF4012)